MKSRYHALTIVRQPKLLQMFSLKALQTTPVCTENQPNE